MARCSSFSSIIILLLTVMATTPSANDPALPSSDSVVAPPLDATAAEQLYGNGTLVFEWSGYRDSNPVYSGGRMTFTITSMVGKVVCEIHQRLDPNGKLIISPFRHSQNETTLTANAAPVPFDATAYFYTSGQSPKEQKTTFNVHWER